MIPEELVTQFRSVAIERLDRIEAAWGAVMKMLDEEAAVVMHRELHTLKGESKMLGFSDVNLVSHKLEDLLEAARARGYAVDEDFDLIVNMAIRFMAMLVRKKVGSQLGGIDLPGFIRQIDSVLAEVRPDSRTRSTGQLYAQRLPGRAPRVSAELRARLEPVAIDAFVEYAVARKLRRDRLRISWLALRELVGVHRAVIGPAQLAKHRDNADSLARELGKEVDVTFEIDSAEATVEILNAIDGAVLHLVRNALDHGIEPAAQRTAAGKSARGAIRVRCRAHEGALSLVVDDDGAGVSLVDVRARAVELGLLDAQVTDVEDRWLELVCQPGFTTRSSATEISGRGAGLDAVRHNVLDVGGTLVAETQAGRGTTWKIVVPLPAITLDVHALRVPGLPFPIAIDASWKRVPDHEGAPVFDLAFRLGVSEERSAMRPKYFARGGATVGLVVEREPTASTARRVVTQTAAAPHEVILLDTTEGLLVYPDRLR